MCAPEAVQQLRAALPTPPRSDEYGREVNDPAVWLDNLPPPTSYEIAREDYFTAEEFS